MRVLIIFTVLLLLVGCANRPTAGNPVANNPTSTPMNDYQTDSSGTTVLFDFTTNTPEHAWRIEDDRVMGGVSQGKFTVNSDGYGHFSGEVSLENNGGFSSVQHQMEGSYEPGTGRSSFILRVKGDGKDYNFRVKPVGERYSFTRKFSTNGDWQTITIPFSGMQAKFRGEDVPVDNYAGGQINMIRFLIGNKEPQTFEILIDKVMVE